MATSGSKTIKLTNYDDLVFTWTLKSQSVANNTSSVYWEMKIVSGAYGEFITANNEKVWKVVVNGTTYSGYNNTAVSNNSEKILAKGTTSIKHADNGSKTFSYSFSQQIGITYAGTYLDTYGGSGTGTLTTIPRASSVSASNGYIRDKITITITRAASTFKHTLQYKLAGQSDYTTLVSKTTATTYSFNTANIAETALNLIPSTSKSLNCAIRCITYDSSGKQIGDAKTDTIKLTGKDADLKPKLSPTIEDTNDTIMAITGTNRVIVRYYSQPVCYFFCDYPYNSKPKSYKIVNGSKTLTKDGATFTDGVESNVFTFTLTDSRGYTVSNSITLNKGTEFIEAVKPTITLTTSTPELTTTDSSTTFKFNANLKGGCFCGDLGAKVAETRVYYRYREVGGKWIGSTISSGWIEVADSGKATDNSKFNNNKTSYDISFVVEGLNYLKAYEIQGRVYNTIEPKETGLQTKKATPVFEWSEDDFNFNVPVKIVVKNESGLGWYSQTNKNGGGLNVGNSDIVGANSIYFGDACNADAEGLCFPNGDSYDYLKAHLGNVLFITGGKSYELCYTKGSQMSIGDNTPIYGYLTNARKSLFLTIPVNKPIVGATGFTVSGKLEMRGTGGYFYNQASKATDKSATINLNNLTNEGITGFNRIITNGGMLRLEITFSTALTHNAAGTTAATNNTPVSVVPNGILTITFT